MRRTPYARVGTLIAIVLLAGAHPARAWDEWASSVLSYSSQYGTTSWSAAQVLDLPDTSTYGDIGTAWAPKTANGGTEQITVGFPEPLYATGTTIRETYGNGFVTNVEALDTSGAYHVIWSGTDPSQPGAPVNFLVTWPQTAYLVSGLRVTLNTNHSSGWEEIDAIQLHGVPVDDRAWASDALAVTSEYGKSPGDYSAFQATGQPDTIHYGFNPHAWAAATMNGGTEAITLGFGRYFYSTGVAIRETSGNGFVTRVDAVDVSGTAHTVWTGQDSSTPNLPAWLTLSWPKASYLTAGLKVFVDTSHSQEWEQIDSALIRGQAQAMPAPVLSSLGASELMQNGGAFPLLVRGSGFLLDSVVRWNGSDLPTVYASSGELHTLIPDSNLAVAGPVGITIFTPAPGGGVSNKLTLTVSPDTGQWASSVIAFSSQYSPTTWSAAQALGPPDTNGYGDISTAWTSNHADVGLQTLTLGFSQPVNSIGAVIRETYNNGFVVKIEALDTGNVYHTVWSGTDLTAPGAPQNGQFNWDRTPYLTKGLRITVDTDHTTSWEEIDAVQLQGRVLTGVQLSTVSPNPVLTAGPAGTLVLNGYGFTSGATVLWNGTARAATFVSSAMLALPFTAADIANPGTVSLAVNSPGVGISNAVPLSIGPTKYGDADGNGTVNLQDVTAALRIAAGITKPTSLGGGDVAPAWPAGITGYGDGSMSIEDAIRIARFVRGL